MPLQELRTLQTKLNDNSLSFITTYNPNNLNIYEIIDKSVEWNKADGFENLKIIKSKRQAPNLTRIITKAEVSQKQVGVY